MLTPEQIARLTPEQLITAERWGRERAARNALLDEWDTYIKAGKNIPKDFLDKFRLIDAKYCEHDRSSMDNCAACDEIERLLHPEFYCALCKERLPDALENGYCEYCRKEDDNGQA
jgi:hypothetical protein